jgi:succinate dehydrogenase / fumarate reductase, iron-sulfur subunit
LEARLRHDVPAKAEGVLATRFKVFRFDPATDPEPHYDAYELETMPRMRVLECLNRIRWGVDPTLSYRMSCGRGICGSDGVTMNGVTGLACQRLVGEFDGDEIVVEPLSFFPVVKDLVVDLSPFFSRMRAAHPEGWLRMDPAEVVEEARQAESDRRAIKDATKCIQCGCCTASCPVNLRDDPEYIGPSAALLLQRYIFDTRTRDVEAWVEVASRPHGSVACKNYFKCTLVCPKGIEVTKAINLTNARIRKKSGG